MTTRRSALILDDDPIVLRLLSLRLRARLPDIAVECRRDPASSGEHDIFILDNDFHGRPLAAELAEEIKSRHPGSLVVALSATLDTAVLKRLINCGCDGAFSKSDHGELGALLDLVEEYVRKLDSTAQAERRSEGVLGTAHAISRLIAEWNQRLLIEEQLERRQTPGPGLSAQTDSNAMVGSSG